MPDALSLRQRFPLGCRVGFTTHARQTFGLPGAMPARVVGYERSGELRIVREGTRHREIWHVRHLERVEEADHA